MLAWDVQPKVEIDKTVVILPLRFDVRVWASLYLSEVSVTHYRLGITPEIIGNCSFIISGKKNSSYLFRKVKGKGPEKSSSILLSVYIRACLGL